MKRRQFLKSSMIVGGVIVGFSGGTYSLIDETNWDVLNVASALKELESLSKSNIVATGEWELTKIFTHCAQSVEYSLSKFPEHKSLLFKKTIGRVAFSIFSSKGRMTHDLSESIPGSPQINANSNFEDALSRLKKSLIDFINFKGKLAPHFAYGELTKSEYEIAHVMHLYNHLQEIERYQVISR